MQDFLHTNHDDVLEAVERFERMISTEKEVYFDVHQIESIFEFYIEKYLFEQADRILQIGLRQHPQASSLRVKQAGILADQGQLDAALSLLKQVAPIESTNTEVFITLGWISLQQNEVNQAVEYFQKAVEMAFEDEQEVLLEIGYNLNQMDVFDESVPFLERLILKNPNHESGLFELAFALDRTGHRKRSIATYQRLLDVNPFSENGWYNLGILYNKEERFVEALQAYEFTIALNPNHGEAFFNKGNSLAHAGEFAEALDAYLENVSLSRDVLSSYQYIADCWEQLGNYDMAIRFYRLVTKEDPENGDAWYGMGTALMEKEEFTGGLQAVDQAISINPIHADYWFAHARGLFELEKVEDACRSLENGLNIDPEEVSGWIELLKLKIVLEPTFDLAEFLKEIHEKYDDVAAIHYLAAVIHFKYYDDKGKAIQEFKWAYEISTDGLNTLSEDFPELLALPEVKSILNPE